MGKKILLIYPLSESFNNKSYLQKSIKNLLFEPNISSTDLMYLASIAEKAGLEAKIGFYNNEKELKSDLKNFKPDYLLINTNSQDVKNELDILKSVKKILPKAVTIATGKPFCFKHTDYLYDFRELDLIIVGEAEETLLDILKELPCSEILGLCYRDGFRARFTGKRPAIEDLSTLPFPARHLVDINKFTCPYLGKLEFSILISRGCPTNCFFCTESFFNGSNPRLRSSENVIAEIRECSRKYKIKHFSFQTNNFGFDRQWALKFCQQLIASKLKITWTTNIRADNIDLKLAKTMYKAGCRILKLGVESGSQYILDKIGKNITLNEIRDAVKIIKKSKIKLHNTFILGLPWDDFQTCNMTIDFATELESDFISFYPAIPLEGSRFFNYASRENLLDNNSSCTNSFAKPIIKTFSLDKETIFKLQKKAYKEFYIRPYRIFKTIISVNSIKDLISYVVFGISLILEDNELINLKYFHKRLQNKSDGQNKPSLSRPH